jgi:hypothetical protein
VAHHVDVMGQGAYRLPQQLGDICHAHAMLVTVKPGHRRVGGEGWPPPAT